MSELIDNIKGVDLKTYISNADNKAKLKDTNLFYVISTSAEPDVFKIGVAFGSEHSPFKALDRLNSYYLHSREKCSRFKKEMCRSKNTLSYGDKAQQKHSL